MAYSLRKTSSLFPASLLLFVFFSLSSRATATLIEDVCSKTQNPPLCLEVLKGDHRSNKADLKGLGLIAIDSAEKFAKETSKLVVSLVKKASDPKVKGRYETCEENYDDTVTNLEEARQALKSGDILGLRTRASAALDGPDTCEDGFEEPPAEARELQQANKKMEGLCSTILAVASRLS
ncbi:pectinesterase inhibitor-like [Diospyros lotus]|uniref:pectinesterase inhibitor-like n=1 Tax=Diospyros lotus TaxID=55363 RepID=UPI0022532689|nr:pectinesterase inhibitor-like [Diospyros lotus]